MLVDSGALAPATSRSLWHRACRTASCVLILDPSLLARGFFLILSFVPSFPFLGLKAKQESGNWCVWGVNHKLGNTPGDHRPLNFFTLLYSPSLISPQYPISGSGVGVGVSEWRPSGANLYLAETRPGQ